MADSFVSKLITELTAKTTASDTDLVPIADSSGNFFKMTFAKLKELITSELNTKLDSNFFILQNLSDKNISDIIASVPNWQCMGIGIKLWNDKYPVNGNAFILYGKFGAIAINDNCEMYYYSTSNSAWIKKS